MTKINCIIIEDQRPAQRILQEYISRLSDLNLLAVHNNATDSLATLRAERVDLIFLDLHLPEIDGFSFLESLSSPPAVIVTTAYNEYAIKGFELNVQDYLLKPFSFQRFLNAVAKIEQKAPVAPSLNVEDRKPYVFVKIDGKLCRLDILDIKYIQAVENYVQIYTQQTKHMLLGTLSNWLEKLHDSGFYQVHKSYIVNLACIDLIKGDKLQIGDTEIPIGRAYKKALMDAIPAL
ncbi:LytTR family DNA-binding domain-containing protein [Pleionea sp. CnH1-48]|uniref:LytR/AlgR family response regulator transcription factor n=1 Tax=Pleionea sp. CnH1-48 TaxID=2954494 RepID=UPI0020982F07|nr:LytTR family DNA-binding domain-containing protein [Pleionea sp. CnH1-48]MCO7224398.1 LytTR family DNA-binding domain-containing protein [Pleionea sp. CnH1-48]